MSHIKRAVALLVLSYLTMVSPSEARQLVSLFSVGYKVPASSFISNEYRDNKCPEGSSLVEILPAADRQYPLYGCEVASDEPFGVTRQEGTKYLDFGGVRGNGRDYSTGEMLNHDNALIDTGDCPAGFTGQSVYGAFADSWGLVYCYRLVDAPSEITYPDLRYEGFTQEGTCPQGTDPYQVFGTNGTTPYANEPAMDPNLYMCLGGINGNPNPDLARIVNARLIGFDSEYDNNCNEVYLDSMEGKANVDIEAKKKWSVEFVVEYQGRLISSADYPSTGSPMPFQIEIQSIKPNGESETINETWPPFVNGRDWQERNLCYPWITRADGNEGTYTVKAKVTQDGSVVSQQDLVIQFNRGDNTTDSPDVTAPTKPSGLVVDSVTSSSVCLNWNNSTDPSGATGEIVSGIKEYEIYKNNAFEKKSTSSESCVEGLDDSTTYAFKVRAIDNAGNQSAFSSNVNGTTDASSNQTDLPKFSNEYIEDQFISRGYQFIGQRDENGFHIINIRPGNKVIYVSAAGDDSNNGLTQGSPVKTPKKGLQRAREYEAQAVFLRRGDTFTAPVGEDGRDGASIDELFYIADYGDITKARPKLVAENGNHGINWTGTGRNRAILNIHVVADVVGEAQGLRLIWGKNSSGVYDNPNFLIENVKVEGFDENINLKGIQNLIVRRSIIKGSRSLGPNEFDHRNQGIYISACSGVLFAENILDDNGRYLHPNWIDDDGNPMSSIYSHNAYFSSGNDDIVTHSNIFARGGSHGIQQRSAGILTKNLFLRNPHPILFGHDDDIPDENSIMSYNTIIDSNDISHMTIVGGTKTCVNTNSDGDCTQRAPADLPPQLRSHCMDIKFMRNAEFFQNMCVQQESGTSTNSTHAAIEFSGNTSSSAQGMVFKQNLIYKWYKGDGTATAFYQKKKPSHIIEVLQNLFDGELNLNNPDRFNFSGNTSPLSQNPDIDYNLEAFIQDFANVSTLEAFMNKVESKRTKANWDPDYSVEKMIIKVREAYQSVLPDLPE